MVKLRKILLGERMMDQQCMGFWFFETSPYPVLCWEPEAMPYETEILRSQRCLSSVAGNIHITGLQRCYQKQLKKGDRQWPWIWIIRVSVYVILVGIAEMWGCLPLCLEYSKIRTVWHHVSNFTCSFVQQVSGQTFGVCTTNDQVLQTLLLICHMFSWF